MALLVTLLLLSFTFSASHLVQSSSSGGPGTEDSINYPGGSVSLHRDDMEVNLVVNQLAILKLLNHINLEPGGYSDGGVAAEMRRLREEMKSSLQDHQAALQQHLTTLIDASPRGADATLGQECVASVQGDVATVKETQTTLRSELASLKEELATLKRESEEERRGQENSAEEVRSIRSVLAALNTKLSLHVNEATNQLDELSASVSGDVSRLEEDQVKLRASLTNLTNIHFNKPNDTCHHTCTVEGVIQVNASCTILDCHQGCLRPYRESSPLHWTSAVLDGKCVHLFETSNTWDAARATCVTLGGDLFVAGDFHQAVQYVVDSGFDAWVGVKERAWLDGRRVTEEEWAPGQPNDVPEGCGFIRPSSRALRDAPCTSHGNFLCLTGA